MKPITETASSAIANARARTRVRIPSPIRASQAEKTADAAKKVTTSQAQSS